MTEPTNMFKTLAELQWQEDPELTLHSWRIRVPCCHALRLHASDGGEKCVAKPQLQIEFMRGIGNDSTAFCTAIVSPVHDGVRGAEYVIDRKELRALRDLLNASDLTDDYHREVVQKPSPPSPTEGVRCGFDCGAPAAICLVCARSNAPIKKGTHGCACGCGRRSAVCLHCAVQLVANEDVRNPE